MSHLTIQMSANAYPWLSIKNPHGVPGYISTDHALTARNVEPQINHYATQQHRDKLDIMFKLSELEAKLNNVTDKMAKFDKKMNSALGKIERLLNPTPLPDYV